ncbi:hypothetical protein IAD21_03220 [Abditibacteriota bacterium]|nr:hypothetical protein IAD21_03220 [Abditibacteriota bacterium]
MTVDVWVGLFSSHERMEQYLEEIYDDDDSTPLSEFAGDMNEFFYDHDFFESSFHETITEDLSARLQGHSLPPLAVETVASTFAINPEPFNAILLMWNEEQDYSQIEAPVSVQKEGVRLRYLGRFENAGPA